MPERLRWPLLALAAAAGLWFALRARSGQAPACRPLAAAAPESIVRLERESGGQALTLAKKAGAWTADGRPARADECERLARGAQALTLTSVVERDASRYAGYGLADGQAVRLRAWTEGSAAPALDVYLGRPAFGGVVYARLTDDSDVRLAQGLDPRLLSLPATGYLLK